jgi:penicillin-binding protein 1A
MRRPLFLVGLAMLASLTGVAVVFARTELPVIDDLEQSSYICASDVQAGQCGPTNAMTRLQRDEDRANVALDKIPKVVQQAVIATEDRDFYEHDGVNPMGIARALFQNLKGGSVSQGGSTITQQYVKNAFKLSTERAVSRKVKEAVLSIKLEQQMSKDEILEGYLNTIYFGRFAYGVEAAAQAYFGKDVGQLGPSEAALLAGEIRAPASAEPSEHPEEATRRRHVSLTAMRHEGYISQAEFDALDALPLEQWGLVAYSPAQLTKTLRGVGANANDYPYSGTNFLAPYVQSELEKIDPVRYSAEKVATGGYRIYTSIDYDMQLAAWNAVTSTLDREDDPATPEWEGDPEAAIVAVDDQGLIRAMVGNRHPYSVENQNNYAVCGHGSMGRQPGSTFKAVVLAEAMRQGYSLKSRYDAQATVTFDQDRAPEVVSANQGRPWKVSNYSESAAGVLDLVNATRESSNTAYAQLIADIGWDGPFALAKSMGYGACAEAAAQRSGANPPVPIPSEVLGTIESTPLEMAGVYSTFANRGVYKKPDIITRIEQADQEGNVTVLYERQVQETRVLSETQADLVTHALQAVVGPDGTGKGANIGRPQAGKTGTSQLNQNAWFAGFVPKLTAVVWMGYPNADYPVTDSRGNPELDANGNQRYTLWPMAGDGRPVHGKPATGGSFPAEIWKKFMTAATAGMPADEFVEPTPQQINSGKVLNDDMRTADETTIPVDPAFPFPTDPGGGGPGGGGGGGGPRPTDPPNNTTTTEGPGNTTTTTRGGGVPPPSTILPPEFPATPD